MSTVSTSMSEVVDVFLLLAVLAGYLLMAAAVLEVAKRIWRKWRPR